MLEIFTDSQKIALNSKNSDTAQSRFELAVEAYYQLMSLRLPADLGAKAQRLMEELASAFPTQMRVNEALGLWAKADKLKTVSRKLEYLDRARDILSPSLPSGSDGAAVQDLLVRVLAAITELEAAPRN